MNIAIVGYGKMGRIVEKIATERGINVKAKIDPVSEGATHKEIDEDSLKDVDVCIEFTAPDVAFENIKKIAELKKNIVVGTTGWHGRMDDVKKIIDENGVGMIYSPNFSIGVNVFFRAISYISGMMDKLEGYDVDVEEIHHIHKKDAPSGTAKKIAEIIKAKMGRAEGMDIKSRREGEVPGTHIVRFESGEDVIRLEHESKSREGFALGSVIAAEWICGKKGLYSIEDMMDGMIKD
ncbi:4-hydroxy-tetrahydrodipicolinate reductase [Candidatus Woesearchaeota archaeon]|nr:4-hydroxy-tetrahydrodipicolinate reductase [Candidatus Woesearchaeota archaeon]